MSACLICCCTQCWCTQCCQNNSDLLRHSLQHIWRCPVVSDIVGCSSRFFKSSNCKMKQPQLGLLVPSHPLPSVSIAVSCTGCNYVKVRMFTLSGVHTAWCTTVTYYSHTNHHNKGYCVLCHTNHSVSLKLISIHLIQYIQSLEIINSVHFCVVGHNVWAAACQHTHTCDCKPTPEKTSWSRTIETSCQD